MGEGDIVYENILVADHRTWGKRYIEKIYKILYVDSMSRYWTVFDFESGDSKLVEMCDLKPYWLQLGDQIKIYTGDIIEVVDFTYRNMQTAKGYIVVGNVVTGSLDTESVNKFELDDRFINGSIILY